MDRKVTYNGKEYTLTGIILDPNTMKKMCLLQNVAKETIQVEYDKVMKDEPHK